MSSQPGSAGVKVSRKMREILAKPGFISGPAGGGTLRNLYSDASMNFDCQLLDDFAQACFVGSLTGVAQIISSGQIGPAALGGTETEFEFGYASLVVLGCQRIRGANCNHSETLKFLLSHGVPPDVPDICGHTALHHTMISSVQVELARILLQNGANIDQQERYGGVPILLAFRTNRIDAVDLLMEAGARLDIADADGITPDPFYLNCGPQVTAAVKKWTRKRNGEEALLEEKSCGNCGKKRGEGVALRACARCRSQMYCTTECQRAHWKTHKRSCNAFSEENTVTVEPTYTENGKTMSLAGLTRRMTGTTTEDVPSRGMRAPAGDNKDLIIKVQVPYLPPSMQQGSTPPPSGPMLVYNKKGDFRCMIHQDVNLDAYKRIADVVRTKGAGGAKAYFLAELKTANKLVIKLTDVLAEQSF